LLVLVADSTPKSFGKPTDMRGVIVNRIKQLRLAVLFVPFSAWFRVWAMVNLTVSAAIYSYWGKAKQDSGAASLHLLLYHCLDVAAVASVWWDASPSIRHAFVQATNLSETQAKAWVLFFIALHDFGKFDLRFQLKAQQAFCQLRGSLQHGLSSNHWSNYDHGQGGLYWFENDQAAEDGVADLEQILTTMKVEAAQIDPTQVWIRAVTGHHGFVRQHASQEVGDGMSGVPQALREYDRTARQAWIAACETLFLAPHGLRLSDAPALAAEFVPFLAGFCSVCDWLGSRSDDGLFAYCATPLLALPAYFEDRVAHDARHVFERSGIKGEALPFAGIEALLGKRFLPRQLQTLIEETPVEAGLSLIEGPTGSGKTETALAMAWRLVAAGLADSIVFALPTQATSNAMYQRVVRLASTLFKGGVNVLLAHGKAAFNPNFSALKERALTEQGHEDAWAQCAEWLASSRKRVFLGQLGIGTIDQVLMAVLPVKHNFVRTLGMGRSVLIVDEVHAYDEYMNTLLAEVLGRQRATGGSAILLSATLPSRQRQELMEAWGNVGEPSLDYPLLTWCSDSSAEVKTFSSQSSSPVPSRQVRVECLEQPEMRPGDVLLARMVAAAEAGAQVGMICNLVDHAQETYRRLRAMTNVPVILFHSRYTFDDRQAIETSLNGLFGPKGDRSIGRILVATQVLEQSIDADMDWLLTQLCPVDLLFQRMGRMHRHSREWRPAGFTEPLCTILLPAENNFGKHGAVYQNSKAMWRTWQKLQALQGQSISFPAAYREWIEQVYAEKDDLLPEWIVEGTRKFEDKELIARSKARQQLRSATRPVADTDESVLALTRDGEMSRSVLMYRDAEAGRVLRDGTLLRVGKTNFSPEECEAMAMNLVSAPASWGSRLPQADDKGVHWLLMQVDSVDAGHWVSAGKQGSFNYDSEVGLQWNNAPSIA
jgi:CRISPR-associated endonuclease/helicase Cas3